MDDDEQRASATMLPSSMAVSADWPAFEARLAEALGVLEEDQYLVIAAKRGWGYVQFAAQGSTRCRTFRRAFSRTRRRLTTC